MSEFEEEQLYTNHALINEIEHAEEVLKSWNASWSEKVVEREDNPKTEDEKYGVIEWYNIDTKKTTRRLIFKGNGDIHLEKENKHIGKRINYDADYNIMHNNFNLSINDITLTEDYHHPYKYDYINVSLKDNILTENLNDITIITDLNTGKKTVKIKKDYDRYFLYNGMPAVNFEANLDENGKINSANAVVTIHKKNGKVKGSYRFDVSKVKGVRANYYTRKGKMIDLMSNQPLLENAKKMLESKTSGAETIAVDFAKATERSLINNVTDRAINFDYSDFSLDSIEDTKQRIRDTVGRIKGEFPLYGLSERINYYLDTVNKNSKGSGHQKVLKIEDIIEY